MEYDAELILTEETLKIMKFEVPIDVAVRLTEQDVQHLKETKKLDYFTDLLIKIKLVKS